MTSCLKPIGPSISGKGKLKEGFTKVGFSTFSIRSDILFSVIERQENISAKYWRSFNIVTLNSQYWVVSVIGQLSPS